MFWSSWRAFSRAGTQGSNGTRSKVGKAIFLALRFQLVMPATTDITLETREELRARERARLGDLRPQIVALCEQNGVAKLSVFGSLLHEGEFGPESDFDFLVEFLPDVSHGLSFWRMEEDLEILVGRQVHLNTALSLSRYFRDEVLKEAEVFYAKA